MEKFEIRNQNRAKRDGPPIPLSNETVKIEEFLGRGIQTDTLPEFEALTSGKLKRFK